MTQHGEAGEGLASWPHWDISLPGHGGAAGTALSPSSAQFHPQALNSNSLPGNTTSAPQSVPEEGVTGSHPEPPNGVRAPVVPQLCPSCAQQVQEGSSPSGRCQPGSPNSSEVCSGVFLN